MKEGIEKIKKDPIAEFIRTKIEKAKDDINPSSLRLVKRKDLIPAVEDIFLSFINGDLVVAQGKIESVKEKIDAIKNKEVKSSNETFFSSFDHDIPLGLGAERTKEEHLKDNI